MVLQKIQEPLTQCAIFLGEVGVPAALEVYEVGPDHVLGAAEDPQTLEPRVLLFGFDLGR